MSRTRNKSEQLWYRIDEVGYLRNKKQQHGFTKVPKDGDYGKRHSREITKRIADKHRRRIPEIKKDDDNNLGFRGTDTFSEQGWGWGGGGEGGGVGEIGGGRGQLLKLILTTF